jgi:uncharacterized protein YggT (Ycf19 family)
MAVTEKSETVQTVSHEGPVNSEKVVTAHEVQPSGLAVVRNVIYILLATLIGLLAIRLLLSLGNANRTNDFADLIYTLTAPFVAPFRGLFSIDTEIGSGARLEYEAIVAMIVYALIGWIILQLLRAPERTDV